MKFQTFLSELTKYSPKVHRLNSGASEEAIVLAENALGVVFPHDYRALLIRWNGGVLFAKEFFDIIVWNVEEPDKKWEGEYNFNVVKSNDLLVNQQNHPDHLLAIASYSDGNLLCLDMKRNGKPVIWLRDDREIEEEWENLEEWLHHEMMEGAQIYEYDGTERQ